MKFRQFFRKREPEGLRVPGIRFLGEQDGPFERLLKEQLCSLFCKFPDLRSAQLVRTEIEGPATHTVSLCLDTGHGADKSLIDAIGLIFRDLASNNAYLDIVFVNEKQKDELAGVCKPFYESAPIGS